MKRSEMTAKEKNLERRLCGVAGRQWLKVCRDPGGYYLVEAGTGRRILSRSGDGDRLTLVELRARLTGPRAI